MDRQAVLDHRLGELDFDRGRLLGELEVPPDGCVVAYVSALEGLGTSLSDVDLYVVWPAAATVPLQPDRIVVTPKNDISLDVEYWPEGNLRPAITRLLEDPITPGGWMVSFPLKALHRMVSGVCLAGPAYHSELCRSILPHRVRQVLTAYYLWKYDGDFEDVAALYDTQDYKSAYLMSHTMLQAAAGVATAAKGCLIFNDKWLYRGLAQAYGPDHPLVRRYWELLARVDGVNLARHVADMLDFGSQLVAMTESP